MRAADLDLLFVPDLGSLADDHWQNRWRERLSTARSVGSMRDHDLEASIAAIVDGANRATRPIFFVAHSVGALAVAHAAPQMAGLDVRGALLAAPPSDESLATLIGYSRPSPRAPLRWPSLLIASRTDPWATIEQSRALAQSWGAEFVDAGESGRLDANSGHGPWPDGLLKLAGLLKRL